MPKPQISHLNIPFIPKPSDKRIAIHITPAVERVVRKGHPWLFDGAIRKQSHEGQAGDLAVVFDNKRRFLAIGLYDPHSPIRVKILHHGDSRTIDEAFFREKIQHAYEIRVPLLESGTTGYRLIHGENDGLPGLIVDRYGDCLVVKVYTAAWIPYLESIVPLLLEIQSSEQVILRLSRAVQAHEKSCFGLTDGQLLVGETFAENVTFVENGLTFAADVVQGHKTGFFFDQHDNREMVEKYANGKSVLDVFAYTGGFSLYAARGGAVSVLSLDVSQPALEAAQHNFALNQDDQNVAACQHEIMVADAFEGLEQLADQGRQFEMVIVDPPSFANSADQIDGALHSYARLTELALDVLKPQGMLVMASCSSRITADEFFAMVTETANSLGRLLWVHHRTGHALDHPIGFPEGAYLKCLFGTTVD